MEKKGLLPRKFGLIKSEKNEDYMKKITIDNYFIGKNYSKVLGSALLHDNFRRVEKFKAKSNMFDANTIEDIVLSLPKTI